MAYVCNAKPALVAEAVASAARRNRKDSNPNPLLAESPAFQALAGGTKKPKRAVSSFQ
jgi:hypothetical protein